MSTENTTEHHREFDDLEAVLEGVGKDAEIVTNDKGGKQSKTPMALHLIDPKFLQDWAQKQINAVYDLAGNSHVINRSVSDEEFYYKAIEFIANFMLTGDLTDLKYAMVMIESNSIKRLARIAEVLQYGADRYEPNNWRLIPQESHINHALIHLIAHLMGDKQDDHLDHALCRLMMAYATEKSSNFSYTEYIPTTLTIEKSESKMFQPGSIYEVAVDHPDFQSINKLQEECHKLIYEEG